MQTGTRTDTFPDETIGLSANIIWTKLVSTTLALSQTLFPMWELKLWVEACATDDTWLIRDRSPAWGETGTGQELRALSSHILFHIVFLFTSAEFTQPAHKDSRVHEGLLRTSLCTCIFSSSFPGGYSFLRSLVKFAVNQITPLCNNLERRSRWRWKKRRNGL